MDSIHVLSRWIVPQEQVAEIALEAHEDSTFSMIVVGSGTKSRTVVEALRDAMPSIGILVVDERDTTMQARERYWEHNPRRGWRRILPATMQVPPQPVDDWAAVILAERVLNT
jgi:RNase H-fold protein (predicted Holliday junction resolvase)